MISNHSEINSVIQPANNTSYDRYPLIFSAVSALAPTLSRGGGNSLNILSFGCAKGDEVFTLAEKYFADRQHALLGVDISENQIAIARSANRLPDRVRFEVSNPARIRAAAPFDIIFAMSVLCSWPGTREKEDISRIFSFERFSKILIELSRYLRVGGVLVIYNSNYRFCDTKLYKRYCVYPVVGAEDSGFVSKFDKDGFRCPEYDAYNEMIFMKTI